jgi:hypothetical protein
MISCGRREVGWSIGGDSFTGDRRRARPADRFGDQIAMFRVPCRLKSNPRVLNIQKR